MKLLTTLSLAALMSAGSAFAASTPTATATPAATVAPAQKHSSGAHCEKQAKEKKLTGDEEKKFVKECKEGKKEG
jgi:Spy/CpxP family protein refolding chaperone